MAQHSSFTQSLKCQIPTPNCEEISQKGQFFAFFHKIGQKNWGKFNF